MGENEEQTLEKAERDKRTKNVVRLIMLGCVVAALILFIMEKYVIFGILVTITIILFFENELGIPFFP